MLTTLTPHTTEPTSNQRAAELMDYIRQHLLPGDTAERHSARGRVALALHRSENVTAALAAEGVSLDN
jgi:hypothetical protein